MAPENAWHLFGKLDLPFPSHLDERGLAKARELQQVRIYQHQHQHLIIAQILLVLDYILHLLKANEHIILPLET